MPQQKEVGLLRQRADSSANMGQLEDGEFLCQKVKKCPKTKSTGADIHSSQPEKAPMVGAVNNLNNIYK